MALQLITSAMDGIKGIKESTLEVRAFSDKARKNRIPNGGFRAQISPASLVVEYKNNLEGLPGINSVGAELEFNFIESKVIKFKLILTNSSVFHYSGKSIFNLSNQYFKDGGKVPNTDGEVLALNDINGKGGSVVEGVERFINLTTQQSLKIQSSTDPQAVYLGLVWGDIFSKANNQIGGTKRNNVHPCYLESVAVNYSQFSPFGSPLRAELDCVFKEDG
jgi:hypothetical protein